MPMLTLRFKDVKIRDYPLAVGQALTIGRKHSNDIVIDNLAVSGSHARIEPVATTFVLRDLDSTNGTFVSGQQITTHNLRHNDVILIGKHELLFDHPESVKVASGARDDYEVDKTRILDTSAYRDITQKNPTFGNQPTATEATPPGSGSFFSRLMKKLFG
jgi:predicted component of type VI protein secretion system